MAKTELPVHVLHDDSALAKHVEGAIDKDVAQKADVAERHLQARAVGVAGALGLEPSFFVIRHIMDVLSRVLPETWREYPKMVYPDGPDKPGVTVDDPKAEAEAMKAAKSKGK